jgi:uncharacterized membrane protein YbaN (DUF454 family)
MEATCSSGIFITCSIIWYHIPEDLDVHCSTTLKSGMLHNIYIVIIYSSTWAIKKMSILHNTLCRTTHFWEHFFMSNKYYSRTSSKHQWEAEKGLRRRLMLFTCIFVTVSMASSVVKNIILYTRNFISKWMSKENSCSKWISTAVIIPIALW